ncbi:galanin receptor 2b-like [Ptychodera flava]|uniref:galanin receptor 2b-like n=1 Tax=Ptychodera flava TaxID=63121 RepID=UPI00396A2712
MANNITGSDPQDGSDIHSTVFDVAIGVVGGLGILGNSLVCLVFARVKSLRTVTNMFILNQSMIDLVGSTVFVLSYLGPKMDPLTDDLRGMLFCKLWLSLYPLWSLFDSSSLNLTAISVERYFAIVHPVIHHNRIRKKGVMVVMTIIWFSGLVIEWFWPYVHYIDNGVCTNSWPDPHLERFVGVMVFVVEYALPMTVFVYCYLKIFLALRQRVKEQQANSISSSNSQSGTLSKASKNVTKMLCVVVVTYFLCWTVPSVAYFQNWVFGGPLDWNGPFYKFTVISVFCNVCFNPIIYALMWNHFRKALRQTFSFGGKNRVSPEQSLETQT